MQVEKLLNLISAIVILVDDEMSLQREWNNRLPTIIVIMSGRSNKWNEVKRIYAK